MAKREVLGRYRGSMLGLAWSFILPLLMLAIYTFVFGYIYGGRRDLGMDHVDFALFLFVGIIVHSFFSECINRTPNLILQNVAYVKKVIFPIEILPVVSMLSALFHATISFSVLVIGFFAVNHIIHPTLFFAPLIFFPFTILIVGLSWMLSSTGVYLRDISQTTSIVTMAAMFLSPVFYPLSALPDVVRLALYFNPLSFIIIELRQVVINGTFTDWGYLVLYYVISGFIAWLGYAWFQKIRKGFADVI